ncbi:MAG TPA: 3-hydroxybenzoate 4-monooxygenase, partial [Amnibacterium sp.]|nr:3-hydroxybenzoate 4-monooxygenase [Amnibacterium sp.]
LMARKPEEFDDPNELADFYVRTAEFPAGFMTQYAPSLITGGDEHQSLAEGFPVGKRFKSALVSRVCDGNPIHLGHHATADGRWRIYLFADAARPGEESVLRRTAEWLATAADSPLAATPVGADGDAWFDVKVVYQQPHEDVEFADVPEVFLPRRGPFQLIDYEKVYAVLPDTDVFAERGIDRAGAVVVVRPDQYVSAVLPLAATEELAAFFAPILDVRRPAPAHAAA